MSDDRDTREPGAFSDNIAPGIDCFTDEQVVQCNIQVVRNTNDK